MQQPLSLTHISSHPGFYCPDGIRKKRARGRGGGGEKKNRVVRVVKPSNSLWYPFFVCVHAIIPPVAVLTGTQFFKTCLFAICVVKKKRRECFSFFFLLYLCVRRANLTTPRREGEGGGEGKEGDERQIFSKKLSDPPCLSTLLTCSNAAPQKCIRARGKRLSALSFRVSLFPKLHQRKHSLSF